MAIRDKVFSEYEVKDTSVQFPKDEKATKLGCIGSLGEELESLTITKKCEGVVTKKRTRGTGTGTLSLSGHVKLDAFRKMYGMVFTEELKEGVFGYGQNSIHEIFTLICRVKDEDGNEKLKAYPKCSIESGISRKSENGAEEVAEIELTITVMPDEYGFGMYECLVEDLGDDEDGLATKWFTKFQSSDLQKGI